TDDVEGPPGGSGQVQGPSEVPGGLRLFRPFQEAAREGDVHRVPGRRGEVFAGALDRLPDRGRRHPGRRRLGERLAARIAVRPAVRNVRFAQGAAGHGLQPRGCPPNREGNDVVKCRVSGYKPRVFGILPDNYMARTRRGPLPEKLQYAPRVRSAHPDRLTGIRGCIELAGARRGHSLVGMTVVDPEGIEVGYVSGEETNVLVL